MTAQNHRDEPMSFHAPPQISPDAAPLSAPTPTYDARQITGSDGTARIVLDDKSYALRITRAGKLILTK